MFQKVELIGRLGKDPECRTSEGGKKKATFSVATSESHKTKSGERVEETEWHNVAAWGVVTDITQKILQKGSLVFIEGKLKTRSWESQSVEKKYVTEIVADRVLLLSGGKSQSQTQSSVPWEP